MDMEKAVVDLVTLAKAVGKPSFLVPSALIPRASSAVGATTAPELLEEDQGLLTNLPVGNLYIPARVDLIDDKIVWERDAAQVRFFRPPPHLLRTFVGLAEAPSKRILQFARQWGPLHFCEHGLPISHGVAEGKPLCGYYEVVEHEGHCFVGEPVGWWRHYARVATAILRIAAKLHKARHGQTARIEQEDQEEWLNDWKLVLGQRPKSDQQYWLHPAEAGKLQWRSVQFFAWDALIDAVHEWLRVGDVKPRVIWGEERIEFLDAGFWLFAALAQQLAAAVTGESGALVRCLDCGSQFVSDRLSRKYCDPCRANGAPQRMASRTYYRRERKKILMKHRARYQRSKRQSGTPAQGKHRSKDRGHSQHGRRPKGRGRL